MRTFPVICACARCAHRRHACPASCRRRRASRQAPPMREAHGSWKGIGSARRAARARPAARFATRFLHAGCATTAQGEPLHEKTGPPGTGLTCAWWNQVASGGGQRRSLLPPRPVLVCRFPAVFESVRITKVAPRNIVRKSARDDPERGPYAVFTPVVSYGAGAPRRAITFFPLPERRAWPKLAS